VFGRNATGGVIQVHTKDPQFDPSADLEGGYGNYSTLTGNAYVTGKVIEDVASNLAVYITDQQNGWGHDVVTGQEAFIAEDWGIRNKWLWIPTSSTRSLLAGDFAYTRGEVGLGFNRIPQFVAAGGRGYCPSKGRDDANPQTSPIAFRCPGAPGARSANLTGAEYYSFGSESIAMASSSRPRPRARLEITADVDF
jgi:outer membrane receptor protein involved in Fe transport